MPRDTEIDISNLAVRCVKHRCCLKLKDMHLFESFVLVKPEVELQAQLLVLKCEEGNNSRFECLWISNSFSCGFLNFLEVST